VILRGGKVISRSFIAIFEEEAKGEEKSVSKNLKIWAKRIVVRCISNYRCHNRMYSLSQLHLKATRLTQPPLSIHNANFTFTATVDITEKGFFPGPMKDVLSINEAYLGYFTCRTHPSHALLPIHPQEDNGAAAHAATTGLSISIIPSQEA